MDHALLVVDMPFGTYDFDKLNPSIMKESAATPLSSKVEQKSPNR